VEKLFGSDLTYNHSSSATDDKAKYIDGLRSGRTKYRKMTPGVRGDRGRAGSHGAAALHRGLGPAGVGAEFVSWQSTGIPNQ